LGLPWLHPEELRTGDVAVDGAVSYANWADQLISPEKCRELLPAFCAEVGIPATAKEFRDALEAKLSAQCAETDFGYPDNPDLVIDRRSERERTGACKPPGGFPRYARTRAVTEVTSQTLRLWRESRGWDVPRMARELRRAARDTGEDLAAHHGLVKMIPQWERGDRAPRERYRLLYLKIFEDIAGGLSPSGERDKAWELRHERHRV
jgi:hypothetical protein